MLHQDSASRAPVALAQKCARDFTKVSTNGLHGRRLSCVGPLRLQNKIEKRSPASLCQQFHEDLGEAVAQLIRVARFMKGRARPEALDVLLVPECEVAFRVRPT